MPKSVSDGTDGSIENRIRKLLPYPEIQLNLLTPLESVQLLLEIGEVEATDAACAAAAQISKVCAYLRYRCGDTAYTTGV